jgi:hypothetical protein
VAKAPTEIKSLARSHTEKALKVLAGIMQQDDAPAAARVAAAQALLDRGWGKATQFIEAETTHRYVARIPEKAATPEKWQQQHAPETTQH